MRRSDLVSLLGITLFAIIALAVTIGLGYAPSLGLDLQGGASVVLLPKGDVDEERLDQAREIIASRVDGLGVAEPEITRQGDAIVVNLPGVKDQDRALSIVGTTAELRFRPVLQVIGPDEGETVTVPPTTVAPEATTTVAPEATTTVAPGTETTAVPAPDTTIAPEGGGAGAAVPASVETTVAPTIDTTVAPTTESTVPGATTTAVPPPTTVLPSTPAEQDLADQQVVLPEKDDDGNVVRRYVLGPAFLTGSAINGASAQFNNAWSVLLDLKGGEEGIDTWNRVTEECFNGAATCPPLGSRGKGLVAIVLDSVVISAPEIQPQQAAFSPFSADEITISGEFDQSEAEELALKLRYGALPVQLEPQAVQTVSATLGSDSLRAGVIAGIIGVGLVVIFMFFYYRLLAIVVLGGLILSFAILWAVIAYLGETRGLALTLAGATGIIVSVGVTVDSYVVFFERLKDDVAAGRSLRSSAQRGWKSAWRTILAADIVSLIGAVLLWWLTVGSVRGFAFFLGLSTVIDIVVAYFFTRPAVIALSRTRWMQKSKVLGIERGEAPAIVGPDAPALAPAKKKSLWHRLYHGETTYDFVGKRRIGFAISAVLLSISAISLGTRGLNLGLDFEGGVAWEAPVGADLSTSSAESVLQANGIDPATAKIQTLSGAGDERLRVQVGPQTVEVQNAVRDQLAARAGIAGPDVSVDAVSPTWGEEITDKAIRALIFFFIAIALYISIRFEWKMAVGAITAVVHDVFISVGIYSVFGFEVTPETVIAFLTILGFSLYDTIVVFDKVHENTKRLLPTGRYTYGDIVNLSMNQTLMRSLNTSLAAILPVLSLLVVGSWWLGAVALQDFALALFIGLMTGSYSSIFIATPILAILKEREPRFRALRQRLGRTTGDVAGARAAAARTPAPAARQPATVGAPASGNGEPAPVGGPVTAPPRPSGYTHPPRPRKKKKR